MPASREKLIARARALWLTMRTERAAPREIFWSVFIGAHLGCSPMLFVRPFLAIALCTALGKNRLWSWVAAHVTGNWLVSPAIVFVEIQLSHRARTGEWIGLTLREVADHGFTLLLDWTLGWLPVGAALGAIVGLAGMALARRAATSGPRAPQAAA